MARIIRRAAKHELDRLVYMCGLLTAAFLQAQNHLP